MLFRIGPASRITRLFAALVLMGCGIWMLAPLYPLNVYVLLLGAGVAIYQGVCLLRERRGKYDLTQLRLIHERELNRDDPEADTAERDMAYCHRCALSVPTSHAICPQCGGYLGT